MDPAQNLAYSYDAAGNVTQIVDYLGLETQDFAYDAFDRLIAAEAEDGPAPYDHTYAYDPLGNITSFNGVPYTYLDAAHRHAVTHLNGAATYSYDANGNMTARPWGGVTQTLSYDAENRLTGVDGATDASFGYDGDGRMVVRTVGSDSTVRIGDYYEWDGTHATSYYLFGGRRVAWRTADGVQYLYADHLGSSVQAGEPIEPHVVGLPLVADGAVLAPEDPYPAPQGQVSAQAEPQASVDDVGDPAVQRYTPYGETRGSETVDVPYQFTGQRNEASIGLYHYGARWYDPALGRFIQADTFVPQPENPQSLNRYSYVYNNPLKYTDPSGRWVETALDIAGIAFDIYQIRQEGWTTVNTLSLVADVGCLLLPFAVGGGMLLRASTKIDDVGDAVRVANAADSARAANVVENVVDAADTVSDVSRAINGAQNLQYADELGIRTVRELRNSAELGNLRRAASDPLEVHHLVEQRFKGILEVAEGDIPGVVLTKQEHQRITNAWREQIAYRGTKGAQITTDNASISHLIEASKKVYADYPVLCDQTIAWLESLR